MLISSIHVKKKLSIFSLQILFVGMYASLVKVIVPFLKAELSRYSQTMQFSQLIQQGGFLADEEMYCPRPF